MNTSQSFLTRNLSTVFTLSIIVTVLMTALSLAGLLFVAGVPFPVEDFIVILVMGLVVFVPFGLFLRGIRRTRTLNLNI